jgi:hypothetical protein
VTGVPRRRPEPRRVEIGPASLSREAWRALGIGGGLAVLFSIIPLFGFLFSPLITIVHEMGHAVVAWAFGYPAVPSFDFSYGGGVTAINEERVPVLLALPYGLLAWAGWRWRRHVPTLLGLGVVTWVYSWLAFTDWHDVVILAMGHGTELLIAGVFLYRAMSGHSVLQVDERPAYAMAALLILIHDVRFGWDLMRSDEARAAYEDAKGGGAWMDFSQIEIYTRVSVERLGKWFVAASSLPVLGAWLAHRYQQRIADWWGRRS